MRVLRNSPALSTALILIGVAFSVGCSSDPMAEAAGMTDTADMTDAVDATAMGEQAGVTGTDVTVMDIDGQEPLDNVTSLVLPPDFGRALGDIENAALLFISEKDGATGLSVSSTARFYTITTPLIDEPVLKAMTMLDSCEVGSESSQINAVALDLPIDHLLEAVGSEVLQITSVSAGDTVELESDAGSFVSLLKNPMPNDIDYSVQDGTDMSMAIPSVLNMNVTGDDFPPVTTSWVTPFRLDSSIQNAVRSIDTSAVLTWSGSDASASVQSRVHIYAGFLDELTGEYKSFQCMVADDGEFALPQNVQALYAGGLSANFVDVARYTRSIQMVNGISVVNVYLQSF